MIGGTYTIVEERGGGTLHISSSHSTWIETKAKQSGTYEVVSTTESGCTLVRVKYNDDDVAYAFLKQNRWTGKIYASSWPPAKDVSPSMSKKMTLLGKSNAGLVSRFTELFLLTERPFLWFAIGLIWILLFPAATVTTGELKTRGTYQSEKALLFGATEVSYDGDDARAAVQVDSMIENIWQSSSSSSSYLCESIRDLLAEKQIDAYIYSHSMNTSETCDVYGILRAPRTKGQEAIVIHGILPNQARRDVAKKPKNHPGDISLILSLADVLSKSNWLSKDIIFLFTNKSVERWLDDYNHGSSDLIHRSGIIRYALSLDIPPYRSRHSLSVLTQGTNGRTPNLDLVHNTISYTSKYLCSSCPNYVETTTGIIEADKSEDTYLSRLSNMLSFGFDLIRGSTGSHGHFLYYGVDALTISVRPNSDGAKSGKIKLTDLGRLVERVIRSMSNTEEHLHHSFWLYLMPSHRHFVSIDEYVYSYFFLLFGAAYQLIKTRRKRSVLNIDSYVTCCVLPVLLTFATGALSFAFFLHVNHDSSSLLLTLSCLCICLVMRRYLNVDIDSCQDLITKVFIISHVPLSVMNYSLGVLSALVGNLIFIISGWTSMVFLRRLLLLLLLPGMFMFVLFTEEENDSWSVLIDEWTHRHNAFLPYLFILYSPIVSFLCVFGGGSGGDGGSRSSSNDEKQKRD